MTEQEYINATNLAKLKTATAILRDILISGDDGINYRSFSKARHAIARITKELNDFVEIEEE